MWPLICCASGLRRSPPLAGEPFKLADYRAAFRRRVEHRSEQDGQDCFRGERKVIVRRPGIAGGRMRG